MNRVKLMFFATLRERAGIKTTEMQIPEGMTVGSLKDQIVEDFPTLKLALQSALIAVNREYAADDSLVPDNAEVAFFPPVSGG